MRALTCFDLALLGALAGIPLAAETFESYAGPFATGANGGAQFAGAWTVHVAVLGTHDSDSFEDYVNGADPNGSNWGNGFAGPTVARINYAGTRDQESFESYPDGAFPNGLSGGSGWAGSFVAH